MDHLDARPGEIYLLPKLDGDACFELEGRNRNDACSQPFDDIADENLTPQQRLARIKAQMRSRSLHFLTSRHRELAGSRSTSQLQRFIAAQWDDMQAHGLAWKPSPRALHRALMAADVECATRADHED